MLSLPIENFPYVYLEGPLETVEQLQKAVEKGNCRLALQLYFYRAHRIFLTRDEVYLPGGYTVLGRFIFEEEPIDFEKLQEGDIIYAENLRNKKGEEIDRNRESYDTKDEWLFYLHSAIYVGKNENGEHVLWHATSIENGTAVWTLEKFQDFYKPISAKRIL